jgi:ABC-type thiamine transport system substrate-binding protein
MNPQKLFNYVLQNLETATNVRILIELHKLLRGKNTKLVLYTYDSFLFDLDKSENLEKEIEKVFEKYQVNVKNSYGSSYDFK